MNDLHPISNTHRLPYLMKIGLMFIGFVIFMPLVSAQTLDLLENTDICIYQYENDKDYCYSIYEFCSDTFNPSRVNFIFKSGKDQVFKQIIKDLEFEIETENLGSGCYKIKIEAHKNPYQRIDNVFCYDDDCFYEYAWWNSSFIFKYPINASTTSGEVTLPVLINDSFVLINDFPQYIWCNYTVNTTRRIVGYLYYTNESFYRCVDETETFSVAMDVDEGNQTDISNPWENDAVVIMHMNGTDGHDSSLHDNQGTVSGATVNASGKIAKALTFDGTSSKIITVTNNAGFNNDNLTVAAWLLYNSAAGAQEYAGKFGNPPNRAWMLYYSGGSTYRMAKSHDGTTTESSLFTGSFTPTLQQWYHIVVIYDSSTKVATLYIDGVPEGTITFSNAAIADVNNLEIGSITSEGNNGHIGLMDEFRYYNRTLTADEITAMYNNTVGGQNFAPLGPVEELQRNTSLLAINEELEDFTFSESNFIDTEIVNFNTTAANTTFLILSSMNIEKLTPGGTNVVSVRMILDSNETILEEDLRTVSGTSDIGSSGTSPVVFSVASGEHNITYQFKRSGSGSIGITNFDFNLIQFVSSNGGSVRNRLLLTDFNHTNTAFTTAFNWTMNKTINSSTFILLKNTLTKTGTGSTVATYFFENLETGDDSPFWQRYLSDSTDIGSVSGFYIDPTEIGLHNHTIQSRQTDAGDVVLVNGSLVDFDLVDSDSREIQFFQVSNESTNLTDSLTLGAGTHLLAEGNILNVIGNSYFISFFTSFSSTTGSQTPRYFINSPNLTTGQCFTEKERTLSDNNDVGNAFAYTICQGLSVNTNYVFRLWVEVGAGETLTQLDEELLGFETENFSITEGQVPPIASEITNPTNGSNVSGSDVITWLPFFDPNEDLITYNITLLNLDGSVNNTIGTTTSTSQSVSWNIYQIGLYFLRVEGCDPGDLCSNTSITIRIVPEPIPELAPSISFCESDDIFRTETRTRTIENGNITDEIIITRVVCQYGCFNVTLSTWGNAGCIESDLSLALLLIAVVLIVVFSIRRIV